MFSPYLADRWYNLLAIFQTYRFFIINSFRYYLLGYLSADLSVRPLKWKVEWIKSNTTFSIWLKLKSSSPNIRRKHPTRTCLPIQAFENLFSTTHPNCQPLKRRCEGGPFQASSHNGHVIKSYKFTTILILWLWRTLRNQSSYELSSLMG